MAGRLADSVAIVTGGGSGIGHRTCETFAREGAVVVVTDRNADAAEAVAAGIRAAGGRAEARAMDVVRSADHAATVAEVLERHGRIDILVNNAGFGFAGSVLDTSEEDWDAIMAVNVKGVFLGCKHVIPAMRAQGGGAIVNTASTTARVGIPDRAAYCATKGAVASLTRAMAIDHVADGIRINAVAPGTVESPYFDKIFAEAPDAAGLRRKLEARQPMERLGRPQEIAEAILFLASPEASFCTGSLLFVDGGWTAK